MVGHWQTFANSVTIRIATSRCSSMSRPSISAVWCFVLCLPGVRSAAADTPQFDSGLLPILQTNCIQCHGAKVRMKDLNLSSYESLMRGSESGPVVVPGKPDESRLYKAVLEGRMPVGKAKLSDQDVAAIRTWIEAGAPSSSRANKQSPLTQHEIVPIMLLRCTVCHGLR